MSATRPEETQAVAAVAAPQRQPLRVEPLDAHAATLPYAEAALAEHYPLDCGLPLRHEYTWQHLNRGRHAELALREGAMSCVDPHTGELLHAASAHVLPGDWLGIVYHFEGHEPFSLVTSSFDQAKLGLYFPARQLFVAGRVDANWVRIGSDTVETLRRTAAEATAWAGAQRGAVLYLGFCNNLGHTMWNDLSGLEAVVDSGALRQVGTVVCGPHAWFPVAELFPELAAAGVEVQRWGKPVPRCVLHAGGLPLRVAGNRITRTLRRRIVGWALAQEREQLPALHDQLNGAGLNLWCNLRLHNKAWVDQVPGIVALAHAVHKALRGQPLRLILDGTPDTAPLVAQAAQALQGVAEVVDATRVPLSRSLVLCGLVDLHLCVVGSGLTLPHWVMGRRGVAHSNRAHLLQQRFWNNVSEGTHDVHFVPAQAVTDLEAPVLPDPTYVNYKLDPGAVLERLDMLYRQLDTGPRRSGFAQAVFLAAQGRFADAAERLISV